MNIGGLDQFWICLIKDMDQFWIRLIKDMDQFWIRLIKDTGWVTAGTFTWKFSHWLDYMPTKYSSLEMEDIGPMEIKPTFT